MPARQKLRLRKAVGHPPWAHFTQEREAPACLSMFCGLDCTVYIDLDEPDADIGAAAPDHLALVVDLFQRNDEAEEIRPIQRTQAPEPRTIG